jgi:hypothetical protein
VHVVAVVWHSGLPVLGLLAGASTLFLALRTRPVDLTGSRRHWPMIWIWLVLAGDAALGEHRPTFEREWKGAVAALFGVSGAILLWRRFRAGRAVRLTGRR